MEVVEGDEEGDDQKKDESKDGKTCSQWVLPTEILQEGKIIIILLIYVNTVQITNYFTLLSCILARVYKEGGRVLNRVYTARNIRSEGSRPLK